MALTSGEVRYFVIDPISAYEETSSQQITTEGKLKLTNYRLMFSGKGPANIKKKISVTFYEIYKFNLDHLFFVLDSLTMY